MKGMMLEPFAATLTWRTPTPIPGQRWEAMLDGWFRELATACQAMQGALIGHIKGLVTYPNTGVLKISLVMVDLPPDMQGRVVETTDRLTLSLNVLVYGWQRGQLKKTTRQVSEAFSRSWPVEIVMDDCGPHPHGHHCGHEHG